MRSLKEGMIGVRSTSTVPDFTMDIFRFSYSVQHLELLAQINQLYSAGSFLSTLDKRSVIACVIYVMHRTLGVDVYDFFDGWLMGFPCRAPLLPCSFDFLRDIFS